MIGFNFEYYKPDTVDEAMELFKKLDSMGKKPIYYGGGTEFISMARMNNVYSEGVIDIKGITQCNTITLNEENLIIGSGVTLSQIAESNYYPLLSLVVKRIADHTIQGKITLGGNLAGTIIYKESSLPLMLSNAEITIAGKNGIRNIKMKDLFNKKIKLFNGELIVKVTIEREYLSLPNIHIKRTKNEKIDYPLITIIAQKYKGNLNIAFSGLCEYPFRSIEMEDSLNNSSYSVDERISKAIKKIPDNILSDLSGSSDYREFILEKILYQIFEEFQGVN